MTSFAESALGAIAPGRLERVAPRPVERSGDLLDLCRSALEHPVDSEPLESLAERARSVVVIISDASRDEPRPEMLTAIFERVPRSKAKIAIASGTHAAKVNVVPEAFRDLPVAIHDGQRAELCADLGTTAEGTRVRILREVAEADLVVVTGRIRPHYFAGYSGGMKGIFPGCGFGEDILKNHLFKADPTARLGRVSGNRCRADMEDAGTRIRGTAFLLNVLCDCDGAAVAAASGHVIAAHRSLVERAEALFVVEAPRAPIVVVADRPPVSHSLYQASKMLPPAGALLEDGGTVIMVAECTEGIEPVVRVNEGIYQLGVAKQLPREHRVVLVSALTEDVVRRSYATYAPSLEVALSDACARTRPSGPIPLLWRAGECIARARA